MNPECPDEFCWMCVFPDAPLDQSVLVGRLKSRRRLRPSFLHDLHDLQVDVEAKSKDQQADYLLEAMRQLDEADVG